MPRSSRRMGAAPAEADTPGGYTPPANPEAEQSVLGAILVRPEVLDRVADLVQPADFYREAHGRIFQAMLDLYGRGEPVDLVTVTALLKERGQLEGVGGPVFLAALSEQVGFAVNAPKYASLVGDKAVLRRLLDTTQEIAGGCFAPVEDVAEFLDSAEQKVFEVAGSRVRRASSPWATWWKRRSPTWRPSGTGRRAASPGCPAASTTWTTSPPASSPAT